MDVPDIPDEEIERYRHMSIDEKLAEVGRLNQLETERQRAEIRAQYGDISEEEMRWRVAALRYGRELIAKALGWDPDAPDSDRTRPAQASSRGDGDACR